MFDDYLHDECTIFVTIFIESVQLRNSVIKCLVKKQYQINQ